jgi:flavodoxin
MSLFIGFGSQTGAAQDIANSIAARAEDELPEVDVEIEALNKFKVCGAAV